MTFYWIEPWTMFLSSRKDSDCEGPSSGLLLLWYSWHPETCRILVVCLSTGRGQPSYSCGDRKTFSALRNQKPSREASWRKWRLRMWGSPISEREKSGGRSWFKLGEVTKNEERMKLSVNRRKWLPADFKIPWHARGTQEHRDVVCVWAEGRLRVQHHQGRWQGRLGQSKPQRVFLRGLEPPAESSLEAGLSLLAKAVPSEWVSSCMPQAWPCSRA